jgi:cytochrome c-type biogenesis protein
MGERAREAIFLNSAFFVLGFTSVFSVAGVLLQTALSGASFEAVSTARLGGGLVIIAFGVLMIVSARRLIPFLGVEHKFRVGMLRRSYATSSVFGVAFALGWTPCVGAILGSIYTLAAVSPGSSLLFLMAFSLGLGLPFLVAGAFISRVAPLVKSTGRLLRHFNTVSGLFLIAVGLLLVTNYIGFLQIFLNGVGPLGSLANPFAQLKVNLLVAISAGALTFFSPCILPLLPAFLTYMSGTSIEAAR